MKGFIFMEHVLVELISAATSRNEMFLNSMFNPKKVHCISGKKKRSLNFDDGLISTDFDLDWVAHSSRAMAKDLQGNVFLPVISR